MSKPNHIVFTTIFHPSVLVDYFDNLARFGHLESTKVWVVGDRKTPETVDLLCREISDQGLEVEYLDLKRQAVWGETFPDFYARIPFNNETRRNIGYLHALADGCERLISIDDDNFPTEMDFIGGHEVAGTRQVDAVVHDPSGYYNICEHLFTEPQRSIFPRGFPFHLRGKTNYPIERASEGYQIGVNAGLWLKEPDIDATTWLNGKVMATAYKGPETLTLAQDTWSPINTQNTSVVRALVPAYLCIPMGWDVPGGKIERYGDIWGGYFLQALIQGLPYYVSFGHPLVEHRRNPHDYVDDLRKEYWGMILTDWMLDALRRDFKPSDRDIHDRIRHLSEFILGDLIPRMPAWASVEVVGFMRYTAENLKVWADTCQTVLGNAVK
ncbi:Reversibly glycosylated polypeptide [compost metagenome]